MKLRETLTICYLLVVTCLLLTGCNGVSVEMIPAIVIWGFGSMAFCMVLMCWRGIEGLWNLYWLRRDRRREERNQADQHMLHMMRQERGNPVFRNTDLPSISYAELMARHHLTDEAPEGAAKPPSRVP